ncbi:hypothetical protein GQ55_2G378500 [Panicum hallii var. hallii]|uniref:Uncharacterized protein n=2 Tax=Panicum hallii TaxID=206008 RepID=A0A2T7EWQ1_9POAL|nr:hypothetical protein PAHAL_2G389200 [Panicum hallii]PUZ72249.1 hypothetical protein GQ55_2G378500 [Panicum hallii var. hallii]
MPPHGAAGARPDAPDGEPELLQPDADPRPRPRQRRGPPRRPRRCRLRRLLQHLVDQVLCLDVPRLLGVHLLHLGVGGGGGRRRRARLLHPGSLVVQVYCEFFNLMTEPKTTDHTVSAVNFLPHDHTSCPLYLV